MSKRAVYSMQHDKLNNVYFVNTSVSWQVESWGGKNQFHSGERSGTIYTQSRFKRWLKKYGLTINMCEVRLLPKST